MENKEQKSSNTSLIDKVHIVNEKEIKGFFREYRFLSNFEPCLIEYDGLTYMCTEAAYQANKSTDPEVRRKFTHLKGKEAKDEGRKLLIRPDWDKVKVGVMLDVTRAKYQNTKYLGNKLVSTGERYLEETNYWGDVFWGVYNNQGNNYLGHILMKVRRELKEGL